MKTKEEIKDWLLENAVNEYGTLDLSGLDFTDKKISVNLSEMEDKVTCFKGSKK